MKDGLRASLAGFALVLVAGLLTFLLLSAAFFMQWARAAGLSGASSAARQAALAAESGLAYAAARLPRDPWPLFARTVENRGDDWTAREDLSPAAGGPSLNPSYAHGEHWRDQGTDPDGACNPAYDDLTGRVDLDGDGRFSAWTGRLRAVRFSLRIESSGSKLPLNGGNTAPPFHNWLAGLSHRGLAHALNNLGALLLPQGHPRRLDLPNTGSAGDIAYSLLGDDLIANRPPGGYRDPAQVARVLSSLGGGAWYPLGSKGQPAGLAEILPYVDVAPAIAVPQGGSPKSLSPAMDEFIPATPVEWATAPTLVLQSIWQWTGCGTSNSRIFWEPGSELLIDDRTGLTLSNPFFIHADEAERLALLAADFRRQEGKDFSWNRFYERLVSRALAPPPDALFDSPVDPLLYPTAHQASLLAKADLAFAFVSPDPHPHPGCSPLAWAAFGIDRRTAPSGPHLPRMADPLKLSRPDLPPYFPGQHPLGASGDKVVGVGLTSRPPVRFSVDSFGRAALAGAAATGTLETGVSWLFLGSQEDFENADGLVELGAIGIQDAVNDAVWPIPWAEDPGRRQIRTDDLGTPDPLDDREYRHVVSLPACGASHYQAGPPFPGFSRWTGGVALAPREAGIRSADRYWSFSETLTGPPPYPQQKSEYRPGLPSLYGMPWQGASVSISIPPAPPVARIINPSVNVAHSSDENNRTRYTPLHVSGYSTASSPGLTLGPFPGVSVAEQITQLAIEGWIARPGVPAPGERVLELTWGSGAIYDRLLQLTVEETPGPQPGARWALTLTAPALNLACTAVVPDTSQTTRSHHVRILITGTSLPDPVRTDVFLYVDGVLLGTDGGGRPLLGTSGFDAGFRFSVRRMDEIRLYGKDVVPPEPGEAFTMGRFVREGTYVSPLFVLAEPADLRETQWTGILPIAGLSAQVYQISVSATGYRDPAGQEPLGTLPLPGGGKVSDLASLGKVRSFRYAVTLRGPAGVPVMDTPVFESIWFTFRRDGRRTGWSRWGS